MASSAAGLREEPKDYGPARLLEMLNRLAKIMDAEWKDPFLRGLSQEIEGKSVRLLVTDNAKFYEFVDGIVSKLAREMKKGQDA